MLHTFPTSSASISGGEDHFNFRYLLAMVSFGRPICRLISTHLLRMDVNTLTVADNRGFRRCIVRRIKCIERIQILPCATDNVNYTSGFCRMWFCGRSSIQRTERTDVIYNIGDVDIIVNRVFFSWMRPEPFCGYCLYHEDGSPLCRPVGLAKTAGACPDRSSTGFFLHHPVPNGNLNHLVGTNVFVLLNCVAGFPECVDFLIDYNR